MLMPGVGTFTLRPAPARMFVIFGNVAVPLAGTTYIPGVTEQNTLNEIKSMLERQQSRPARKLTLVQDTGADRAGAPPALDVALLETILDQVTKIPSLDATARAKLTATVYAAMADSDLKPTKAAVLRLLRSA